MQIFFKPTQTTKKPIFSNIFPAFSRLERAGGEVVIACEEIQKTQNIKTLQNDSIGMARCATAIGNEGEQKAQGSQKQKS